MDLAPLTHIHRETHKAGTNAPHQPLPWNKPREWLAQALIVVYVVTTTLVNARYLPLYVDTVAVRDNLNVPRLYLHTREHAEQRSVATVALTIAITAARNSLAKSKTLFGSRITVQSGDKSIKHVQARLSCLRDAQQSSNSESQGQRCFLGNTKGMDEQIALTKIMI